MLNENSHSLTKCLEELKNNLEYQKAIGLTELSDEILTVKLSGVGKRNANIIFFEVTKDKDSSIFKENEASVLFDKIIDSIGKKREDIYITGSLKLESYEEENSKIRQLSKEIKSIKPKAACFLEGEDEKNSFFLKNSFKSLSGIFYDIYGIKVVSTYHPALLLKDKSKKKDVWEVLKKVKIIAES